MNFRRYDLFFVINRHLKIDANTEMFYFYIESIALFIWMTFDLSCNLSSIESNDFYNSLSLFCSWNAFFRRVSIRLKHFDFINATLSKHLRLNVLKTTDIEHHEMICFHSFIDLRYISWDAILSASSLRAFCRFFNCFSMISFQSSFYCSFFVVFDFFSCVLNFFYDFFFRFFSQKLLQSFFCLINFDTSVFAFVVELRCNFD